MHVNMEVNCPRAYGQMIFQKKIFDPHGGAGGEKIERIKYDPVSFKKKDNPEKTHFVKSCLHRSINLKD